MSAGARLRKLKSAILRKWETRAKRELPAAKKKNHFHLLNSLPEFLDEIADCLDNEADAVCLTPACREHGEQRASLNGYTFAQVHREYHILREILFDELEPLTKFERNCVLNSIFVAIGESGSAYVDKILNKEKKVVEQLRRERDARSQFVATLAHDLRNPLQAVRTTAYLFEKHGDNPDVRQQAGQKLSSALKRAEEMIADLLDVYQIRAGQKLQLKMARMNLYNFCEDIAADLKTAHGDRFRLHGDETITGYWNAKTLRRAVENLASNAVKYGAHGSPIIIMLQNYPEEIRLSVHNAGNPIPKREQRHLFEPFYRSLVQREQSKGWGLGLVLVRGIAESHGGKVEVQSDKTGTTFTIHLPHDARKQHRRAARHAAS